MYFQRSIDRGTEVFHACYHSYGQSLVVDVVPVQDSVLWSEGDALSASQLKRGALSEKTPRLVSYAPPSASLPEHLPYSNNFEDFRQQSNLLFSHNLDSY
jgi:hypothetical protein